MEPLEPPLDPPLDSRCASDNLILSLHDIACSNNNNVIMRFCLPDHDM